jgi:hypothetical protein
MDVGHDSDSHCVSPVIGDTLADVAWLCGGCRLRASVHEKTRGQSRGLNLL